MFRILLLGLFMTMVSGQASAQEAPAFDPQQRMFIKMAQDHLAKLRTVRANFIQTNPGTSEVSSGEILISKPGRLKMAYSSPFKIDYYVNDDDLVQYDHDLDEVTRGEAPENPLKILLYDGISLENNNLMDVTNVVDQGTYFEIYLLSKTREIREISGMILKFRKNPIEMTGIERVDNEGNKTETNFSSVEINKPINEKELVYRKTKSAFPNSKTKKKSP